MIKVAIVGCGKIADAHASAISFIPNAVIVGACDNEILLAKQLHERYKIGGYFNNLRQMLEITRPDVVHITTPPQSHFHIAETCINAACHLYIEKPFTVNSDEARRLILLAEHKNVLMTVGTDEQFSHISLEMRELIANGYLGGQPIHMDAYYCYDLGDERYARVFLANKEHWVRTLAGQLAHNIISHGIARIAEYLTGNLTNIIAYGFTSNFLLALGETELIDEIRVIIEDSNKTTAYFTFSTQMRPLLREFRVYGKKNGLILNQDHHTLIKVPGDNFISYLDKFRPPYDCAKQYLKNALSNIWLFIKRDFHMKEGQRRLIRAFYRSISEGLPLPISYREILLTVQIMDRIFEQIHKQIQRRFK